MRRRNRRRVTIVRAAGVCYLLNRVDGFLLSRDKALTLSTQANIDVTGSVTAHIIPRVDFGIDIGDGLLQASVFLKMDLGARLDMQLHADTTITKTSGGSNATNSTADADAAGNATAIDDGTTGTNNTDATVEDPSTSANGTGVAVEGAPATDDSTDTGVQVGSVLGNTTDSDSAAADTSSDALAGAVATADQPTVTSTATTSSKSSPKARSTAAAKPSGEEKRETQASGSADGCVTLTGTMSIDAGLQGTLQPLFSQAINFPIFSTSTQLFQKCFDTKGASAQDAAGAQDTADAQVTRRRISGGSTAARLYRYKRAKSAGAVAGTPKAGDTKNEITPAVSTASTSSLFCGGIVSPLGSLLSLI